MEKIELLKSLILCASALVGFVSVCILFVKAILQKLKRGEVSQENLTEYATLLLSLITKAEGFVNWTGDEKKNYVLSNVMSQLLRQGTEYDEASVSADVDTLVTFSKQVNAEKKRY